MKTKKLSAKLFSLCLIITILMSCLSLTAVAMDIPRPKVTFDIDANLFRIVVRTGSIFSERVQIFMVPNIVTQRSEIIADGSPTSNVKGCVVDTVPSGVDYTFELLQMNGTPPGVYHFFVLVGESTWTYVPCALLTKTERDNIIAAFNSPTISGIQNAVNVHLKNIGVDTYLFDGTQTHINYIAEVVANLRRIRQNDSYTDIEQIRDDCLVAVAYNAIRISVTREEARNSYNKFEDIIGTAQMPTSTDARIKILGDLLDYGFNDPVSLENSVIESKMYQQMRDVANTGNRELLMTLVTNTHLASLKDNSVRSTQLWNRYENLSSNNKGFTFVYLLEQIKDYLNYPNSLTFNDINDFFREFERAINAAENTSGNQNPPHGGNSGNFGGYTRPITVGQEYPTGQDQPYNFIDHDQIPDWGVEYIYALVNASIISGYPDGTILPNNHIKRGEFASLICRALKLTLVYGVGTFEDTSNDEWYAPYVEALVREGIANGIGDNFFDAESYITRQDAASLIYRALVYADIQLPGGAPIAFADAGMIADYAASAVDELSGAQIIIGSEGYFNSINNITRAETAKIIAMVFLR